MTQQRSFNAVQIGITLGVASVLAVGQSMAQEPMSPIKIEAPAQAMVGATVEVRWQGEVGKLDFVSIDLATAPEREYNAYFYPSKVDGVGKLRAPETPGKYAVRYHSGASGYAVRGLSPIEVIDTTATFQGPLTADAGAQVEIHWTGPANERDYISIDPAGSDDAAYGKYAYTKKTPVKIRAPEQPGQYLVRYHLGQTRRVIGQTPLTVGAVTATLEAPAQVQAGSTVSVTWTGPGHERDYISIDPAGASKDEYLRYSYTKTGNPVVIQVPEEVGSYEIRYHQGQARTVLGSIPLEVLANTATIAGPASVAGGSDFEVAWTGPGNASDYITIVPVGAPAHDYLDYTYTKSGSPLTIGAPLEPGAYELRYMTGRSRQILAQVAIEVTPGAIPGTLRVFAGTESAKSDTVGAVEVILDASGSMLKRLDGERRIEIAKDALANLVNAVIPARTPFALRVFGHKEADSCRTDLEIPVAALDARAVSAKIQAIQAMNLAKTPIAASLHHVKQDLAGIEGPVTIVLLTDGEETCDGDPGAAIEALQTAGMDVRVNIVGFAINELELKEQFEAWARVGNGRYIEAHDKDELEQAINRSLEVPFEVLSGDEVVAVGVVNGEALSLLPGTYRVRVLGSSARDLGEVKIEARGDFRLNAAGD